MTTATETANKETILASSSAKETTKQHRAWWRIAAETVSLTAASLLLLEAIFNVSGVGLEEILQPDRQLGTVHIPNKRVVWRMEGYSDSTLSSAGLRDREHALPKQPGVKRIVMLGDSATEGLQVAMEETYASKLEKLLNDGRRTAPPLQGKGERVEVLNFGCSGYSTGQEVLQFEKQAAAYQPDVVVLLYNKGDSLENVRKPYDLRVEPRPYFFMSKDGQVQEDDAVLTANAKPLRSDAATEWLRRNSRIFGILNHSNLTLSINEPWYRKLRGWILFPFTPKQPKFTMATLPYGLQDSQAVADALVRRLNDDCKLVGAKLIVLTFPNGVKDHAFAKETAELGKLAAGEGFSFADLTEPFANDRDPRADFLKYHFSAKGHQLIAQQIAQILSQK